MLSKINNNKTVSEKIQWILVISGFLILFIVFLYSLFYRNWRSKELEKHGCSTVAKTIGTHFQYKHGRVVDYEYWYNGERFEGSELIGNKEVKTENGYYYIKVVPNKPHINKINLKRGNYDASDYSKHHVDCPNE